MTASHCLTFRMDMGQGVRPAGRHWGAASTVPQFLQWLASGLSAGVLCFPSNVRCSARPAHSGNAMSHLSLCLLPTLNDCSSPAAELHDLLRVFIRPDGFRPLCLVITFTSNPAQFLYCPCGIEHRDHDRLPVDRKLKCHSRCCAAGNLVPCPRSSQQALLCTRMGDLAPNGTALCTVGGRAVSDDLTRCYNGLDHPMVDSCRSPPQPRRSPPTSPPPAKKRAANKGGSKKRKKIAKVSKMCGAWRVDDTRCLATLRHVF